MNWINHMKATTVLSTAAMLILQQPISLDTGLWITISTLSALLPDLDAASSKATKFFDAIIFITGFAIGYYIFTTILPIIITAIISFVCYKLIMHTLSIHHRGPFHSLLFPLVLGAPLYLYTGWFLASAVAFGCICHMAEDLLYDTFKIGGGKR